MKEERLNGLARLHIDSNRNLKPEDIVDTFLREGNHRV